MTLGTTEGESPRDIRGYAWNRNIPGSERMVALIGMACREGENGIAAGMIDELLLLELDAKNPDKLIPALSENIGSIEESEVLCDVRKKSRMAGYRVVAIVRELAGIEGYVTALSKACDSIEKNGLQGTIDKMPDCQEYTEEVSRMLQHSLETKGTDWTTAYILKAMARERKDGKQGLKRMLKYELGRKDWSNKDNSVIRGSQIDGRMPTRAKRMIKEAVQKVKKGVFLERDDYQYQPRIPTPTFAEDINNRINDACGREFPIRVTSQMGRPAPATTAKRFLRVRTKV